MKKNLNISYLNGAEGLHKRGGASSGGSSSGGGNDTNSYYKVNFNDDSYHFDSYVFGGSVGVNLVKSIIGDTGTNYDGKLSIVYPDYSIASANIVAICGTAMPIRLEGKIIDNGDWKTNMAELECTLYPGEESMEKVFNYLKFLEPITKEEFYNLDNNNVPV